VGFRIAVLYLTPFDFTVEAAEALGSNLIPGIVYWQISLDFPVIS
jgi:hypothetical protein